MNLSKSKIYTRATNPRQYDLPDLSWKREATTAPTRSLYFNPAILKVLGNIDGKKVLDIGSGAGQLLDELTKRDAKVLGIEPSRRNVKYCKKLFPKIRVENVSLQDFNSGEKFDVITCVLVLNHIADLSCAFSKIKSLLARRGKVYLIVEDIDYYKKPRHNYPFEIEKISESEFVISVKRRFGTIADVIRPVDLYLAEAKKVGLKLEKHVEMKFPKEFLEASPRYKSAEGLIINHLLIFEV